MTLKQAQTVRHTERQQQHPSSPPLPFVVASQVLKVWVKEHSPEVVLFPSPISLIPKLIPFYRGSVKWRIFLYQLQSSLFYLNNLRALTLRWEQLLDKVREMDFMKDSKWVSLIQNMLNTLSFYRGLKNHEQISIGQYDGLYFLMVKCGNHQELDIQFCYQMAGTLYSRSYRWTGQLFKSLGR